MKTFTVVFDGSLQANTSGAAFEVPARDEEHAKQILTWLKEQAPGCTAYVKLSLTETAIINY